MSLPSRCRNPDGTMPLVARLPGIMFEVLSSGGSKGVRGMRLPSGPKVLHFHAVFGKFWLNSMLAPPPLGNPGSATAVGGTSKGGISIPKCGRRDTEWLYRSSRRFVHTYVQGVPLVYLMKNPLQFQKDGTVTELGCLYQNRMGVVLFLASYVDRMNEGATQTLKSIWAHSSTRLHKVSKNYGKSSVHVQLVILRYQN